jgi:hypothetical protein
MRFAILLSRQNHDANEIGEIQHSDMSGRVIYIRRGAISKLLNRCMAYKMRCGMSEYGSEIKFCQYSR